MDVKFNPGLEASGIDPKMVQKLIEVQKMPVEQAKARKEKIKIEKEAVEKLGTLLNDLNTSLISLKTKNDFYKLKLDSSHPDIIDGNVSPGAVMGTYEFEVRSMARTDKQLAYGFPDKDETPVGLGYMLIQREDGEPIEMEIEPNTTLQEVANKINDARSGVRAMVVNTKYQPDPYRLLVVSEKSGKEANIYIDPDTTFLEFKEQVVGRNLDVLFEDVPVTDDTNTLTNLIEGLSLTVRRSEPGTKVQVSIIHDLEATMAAIKTFVEKYNAISEYINGQFQKDPKTDRYGLLAGDGTIKSVMRQLQSALGGMPTLGQKFSSLADIGITTIPKTGLLNLDESKVKAALTEDYEGVARIFINSGESVGVAENLAERLKALRDPSSGAVKSKLRGLKQMIDSQDKEIERRERELETNELAITRKFSALESTLSGLKGQGDFLKARLGGQKE